MAKSVSTVLPRATPESVGVPSEAILNFLDSIEAKGLELHSLMFLRHDQVIAEGWWHPYRADRSHLLYSLSKSFASTAIGMLVDEGKLSLDDPVVSFFPDETPSDESDNLKAMRIRDLLTMTAGHAQDDMSELRDRTDNDWVRGFLARPVPYAPGTHFLYNTSATYMCSAILTRVTGVSMLVYLLPRLFEPLGIEHPMWETCPKGITFGGSGLSVTTEDIAKFGTLYRRRGDWFGQRIVSAAWVDQATSAQAPNGDDPEDDWSQGYGFQFWRCRHGAYRGDGAFGQFCIVIPETEMVVAITSSVDDMGEVLQSVWDFLRSAPATAPGEENPIALTKLRHRLDRLELNVPTGSFESEVLALVNARTYDSEGRSFRFDFDDAGCTVRVDKDRNPWSWRVGQNRWEINVAPRAKSVSALQGAWTSPNTYTIFVKYLDGPKRRTIECKFEEGRLTAKIKTLGQFGPSEGPTLEAVVRAT